MEIRIKNTKENKKHLDAIGQFYTEEKGKIILYPNAQQRAYLQTGQITKRAFKKSLGL